ATPITTGRASRTHVKKSKQSINDHTNTTTKLNSRKTCNFASFVVWLIF
ncbi:unnamed protein product, partial [marine sediment metagenome]